MTYPSVLRGLLASALLALAGNGLAIAAPPENDNFKSATVLAGLSGDVNATTLDATLETGEDTIGVTAAVASIWYRFTPPSDGFLVIEMDEFTSEGGFLCLDPYTGKSLRSLSYNFDADVSDKVFVSVRQGTASLLRFDSNSDPGAFQFHYQFLTGGLFDCIGAPHQNPFGSEFWLFTEGTGASTITVARRGSSSGAASVSYRINHYTTTAEDFDMPLTGTLNFAPGETQKTVQVQLENDADVEGQEFFAFELYDASANTAVIASSTLMRIDSDDSAPTNDNFASAIVLTGNSGTATTPAGAATAEPGEPPRSMHNGNVGELCQSIWYQWTAPADGILELEASRDNGVEGISNLPIAVFTGNSLAQLKAQSLFANDEIPSASDRPRDHARLAVKAGTTYSIAVLNHASGLYNLDFDFQATALLRFRLIGGGADFRGFESEGAIPITVERIGSTAGNVTVDITTREATFSDDGDPTGSHRAKLNEDITPNITQLFFQDGVSRITFEVPVVKDAKKESFEKFFVGLGSVLGNASVDPSTETGVFIFDGKAPADFTRILNSFTKSTWFGLLEPQSGPGGRGSINVSLTRKGGFTGSVLWDGKKYPIKGTLPSTDDVVDNVLDSEIQVIKQRSGLPDLTVTLRHRTIFSSGLDRALLLGSVSDGTSTSLISTDQTGQDRSSEFGSPEKAAGSYTMTLAPDLDVPAEIRQSGVASVLVKPNGMFKVKGTLPDGTRLVAGGKIGHRIVIPGAPTLRVASFFLPLYKTGHFSGTVRLCYVGERPDPASSGDGEGSFAWVRPELPQRSGPAKPAFSGTCTPFVSRYQVARDGAILAGTPPLSLELKFADGGVGSLSASVDLTKSVAKVTSDIKAKMTIQKATGLFQGSFTPAGGKSTGYKGVILQNLQAGSGFFLNEGNAGIVLLGE